MFITNFETEPKCELSLKNQMDFRSFEGSRD